MAGAERVHLIGLVSDGGVHSGWKHLRALIGLAAERGVEDLVIHAFTDGRDTLPNGGEGYLETVEGWCREAGAGRIGTVVGRYFAMDRDKRWDRTQKAYDLLVHGRGEHDADSGAAAVKAAYERDETDEFITPTTIGDDAAIRPGTASSRSTSAPTGCARSRRRSPIRRSTRSTAAAPSRSSAT